MKISFSANHLPHREKCGYLHKDKSVGICTKIKVWSYAHRKNYGNLPHGKKLWSSDIQFLHTDNNVFTKVWSSAKRQKCGNLLTDKNVVICLDLGNYKIRKVL